MNSWIQGLVRDMRRRSAAFAGVVGVATFACATGTGTGASVARLDHETDATVRETPSARDPGLAVVPALVRSLDPVTPVVNEVTTRLHVREVLSGEATYYADKFDGRRTASGIVFRQREPYAAHRTLPFGTVVRVTNERNGRSVVVRVVDRGPWGSIAKRRNTIIDLSRSAAEQLGYIRAGRTPVRVEVLHLGPGAQARPSARRVRGATSRARAPAPLSAPGSARPGPRGPARRQGTVLETDASTAPEPWAISS